MGMMDNLRNFFKNSNNTPVQQTEDIYEKSMLATQIINLIGKIKSINCFDSSIWNLNKVSKYEFMNLTYFKEMMVDKKAVIEIDYRFVYRFLTFAPNEHFFISCLITKVYF